MKIKLLEKICEEKVALLNGCIGAFWGTLDTLIFGFPILSAGAPVYQVLCTYASSKTSKEMKKFIKEHKLPILDRIKNYTSYAVGASIPFVIKYYEEIVNLFNS